jgi:hypothetical protein
MTSVIRFSNHLTKLAQTEEGNQCLRAMKTMRIMVPGDGRDYCGDGEAANILDRGTSFLTDILPLLSNLTTFSIMAYGGARMNGIEDFLGPPRITSTRSPGPRQDSFARVIKALPPSVKDLALDLAELSRSEQVLKCHLCPAINSIAHNLENINLHRTLSHTVIA